jgi:hypothetical protein
MRFRIRDLLWLTALVVVTLGLGLGWWRDHQKHAKQAQSFSEKLASTHEENLKYRHVLRQLEQIYEKETGNEILVSWPGQVIVQPPEPAEPYTLDDH